MKRSEDEQAFSPKRKYMREGALSANSSTHIDDRSGIVENAKGEHSRSPRRNCEGIDRSERPAQHQEVVVIDLVDDDEPTEGEGITSETMVTTNSYYCSFLVHMYILNMLFDFCIFVDKMHRLTFLHS